MLVAAFSPNPWMILPFGLLLTTIALAPLFFAPWWNRHYPKVAIVLGAITVVYYLFGLDAGPRVLHTAQEYFSFICLIGSLFVVSGGILVNVRGGATPLENLGLLGFGAVISNVLGTTGASMLLIRPWIRMNRHRLAAHHVVFFIFVVSNVGGALTPIGDPPLFLGYLKGVPFWWVARHCWEIWAVALALLLIAFWVVDLASFRRMKPAAREEARKADVWTFRGGLNVAFLGIILTAVFFEQPLFLREGLMITAGAGSYLSTAKSIHLANNFNFHPVKEVAILFLGIFATMMPALDWLQVNANQFGDLTPTRIFWASGSLSSILDNAPTYLSFLSLAMGSQATPEAGAHALASSSGGVEMATLLQDPEFVRLLMALSMGAVFFGANTYIGNGPNFMVKAIAEEQRCPTPTFLGYVARFTLPVMLPTLLVVWWVFFR